MIACSTKSNARIVIQLSIAGTTIEFPIQTKKLISTRHPTVYQVEVPQGTDTTHAAANGTTTIVEVRHMHDGGKYEGATRVDVEPSLRCADVVKRYSKQAGATLAEVAPASTA